MATVTTLENDCLALDSRIAERARAVREGREFTSKPDAKPMATADVCNLEPLAADELKLLLRRLELSCPRLYAELVLEQDEQRGNDWDKRDYRWTLTPHAVRRINEQNRKELTESR